MAQPISRLQIHRTSYIVIPARLASTRLPRKLLLQETGKSVIHHTYEAARGASRPLDVCVAVDDQELFQHVHNFGGTAIMTDPNAASGTDRVAEIASGMPHIDIFVNVQGDEPEISGRSIDYVIDILENDPLADIATLAAPIRCEEALRDPSCVKVVCDEARHALYFSRSPIPCVRDWNAELLSHDPPFFHQHLGIYAYRRDFLLKLSKLPRSPLEKLENLEQLRFLSSGHVIAVGVVDHPVQGIDTADDYRAFVKRTLSR